MNNNLLRRSRSFAYGQDRVNGVKVCYPVGLGLAFILVILLLDGRVPTRRPTAIVYFRIV